MIQGGSREYFYCLLFTVYCIYHLHQTHIYARAITATEELSLEQDLRDAIDEDSDYRDTVSYCPSVHKSSFHRPPNICLRALVQLL